ncbi:hypothetical protein JCM24511_07141 [Saitozyma sp. JCM 24511]|nr:hypothetical protein JCM24511_07141 [Saitozyma sp. JCM 24511]
MSLRPTIRHTQSSPGSSPSLTPSLAPSPPPLNSSHSSSHVSILVPDKPRSRPSSAALTPQEIHSALHHPGQPYAHGHSHSPVPGSVGMPRTSTQTSAGEGRYRKKVGFEAFEKGPATMFAFTCQAKSEGYKRSRNTRVFAVAVSNDESGDNALEWLMSELVEDGDEVVAIRVIELDEGERTDPQAQEEFREEAHLLLESILDKNNEADDRRISVIVEFLAGRVPDMLLKMIALYRPDSLVVGTKGSRSRLQSWGRALGAPGMGSVSRFAVSHSPVPVIVVRPERKVKKTLEKRQADPKRGQYAALVGPNGMELSRSRSRERSIGGLSD